MWKFKFSDTVPVAQDLGGIAGCTVSAVNAIESLVASGFPMPNAFLAFKGAPLSKNSKLLWIVDRSFASWKEDEGLCIDVVNPPNTLTEI